jgi:hypothetical protein
MSGAENQSVVKVVLDLLLGLFVAVAPSLPYISQYKIIKRTGLLESFSHAVCGINLFGQPLRVFFWYCGIN